MHRDSPLVYPALLFFYDSAENIGAGPFHIQIGPAIYISTNDANCFFRV